MRRGLVARERVARVGTDGPSVRPIDHGSSETPDTEEPNGNGLEGSADIHSSDGETWGGRSSPFDPTTLE